MVSAMKIHQEHSEPEHVKDRSPYRIRIEGKDGQIIEIVEQMNGGFYIAGLTSLNAQLAITPLGMNAIILKVT